MKNHSVIVFDLGNVLLPFDYTKVTVGLDKIEKGLGSKFVDYYRSNYEVHRKFERGEYSVERFTKIMLEVVEHKISKDAFYKIYSEIFTVNDGLVEILPELKKNYRLILLSNTNAIHQKYGWGNYRFLKYFDKLILSHEVGAVKPEIKIYKAVEEFTQTAPQEHFYVDDIQEYVSAARELGWDAVQFVENGNLFEELKKYRITWNDGSTR